IVGREATKKIVNLLRGKNRNDFTPNLDLGNYVVLINARHITFTGNNKLDNEKYRNHSGYPGGLRERTLREMLEKYPEELVFRIIRGMIPHTKLGDKQAVLEKHTAWTVGRDKENKDSISGFILSNGKKKVDIVCEKDNYDLAELDTIFGGKEDYQKLREIFPEDKTPFLSRKTPAGYNYMDYYTANKAEIDQFNESNYSHGVVDPSALASQKSDLVGKYDKNRHKLIECAGSQGIQTLREFLNVHWLALTDVYGSNRGNKYTIANFENHSVGFDPDCCDQNGNPAFLSGGNHNDNHQSDPISGQDSKFSDLSLVKEQVVNYMKQNNIFRLTLDNNKLVIEYNNSSKKEKKEINSQQLRAIQNYLKSHNNCVNLEQLNRGANLPTTDPDKKPDYIF
ncbi:4243_t:CDS:2, partial [Funneliformis geosporum]